MRSVVTMGVFDGVHRGHRYIFKKVLRRARQLRATSIVYTFDPHPVKVLVPDACPPMIMTFTQKREQIKKLGMQKVVVQKFTRRFARLSPQQFFNRIIIHQLKARELFVGYDFTFGFHRSGTAELLESLGKKAGIRVTVVEPFLWKETLVSSTRIRQLLARGLLRPAQELIGSPYTMEGKVIRGRGIGKSQVGIHTANLRWENDLILPAGVYATYTLVKGKRHRSVTNIGPNPTFGVHPPSVETHLLNFNKNILGEKISIEFVEKIREEIAFASAKELAAQIQNDIKIAKKILRSP